MLIQIMYHIHINITKGLKTISIAWHQRRVIGGAVTYAVSTKILKT
jgi:hypothetical protein